MSALIERLIKEIAREGGSNQGDKGYPDYSDYITHSDDGSWSDNWNDGPTHSDAWNDLGWPVREIGVSENKK